MKKTLLLLSLVLALVVTPLHAWSYLNQEKLAAGATAVQFTTSIITPNGSGGLQATHADCVVADGKVVFTIVSGSTLSTSNGTPADVGYTIKLDGHDTLVNFQVMRSGSTSGNVYCTVSAP